MIDRLRAHWKKYALQSFLAALFLFPLLFLLTLQYAVIIASIGASTFIVFAMPKSFVARPRSLVGGQLTGLFSGFLCSLLPHSPLVFQVLAYSLAVGLALFLMVSLGTEHPPGAATSLGMSITGFSWAATIAVIISIVVLSVLHHFLKPHLEDLVLLKEKPIKPSRR
ncbi:MAG: HPP family protein [Dehalococcoidia bacterium]|nr:HPP family protein [Dehalococcoidia bacterium]